MLPTTRLCPAGSLLRTDEEIEAVLAKCSLRLKHILVLMWYAPPDDPFIARNCRVKIVKQLAAHKLVELEEVGRLDWLRCVPTLDGEKALEVLVGKLRVRPSVQMASERARAT